MSGLELSDVPPELRAAVGAALASADVEDGHLAVELVAEERIQELNRAHRGRDEPTDVLSFPLDGTDEVTGPRELGDVVVCPEHADDVQEAVVHGVLHLCGLDHETDEGEMLDLQERVLARLRAGSEATEAGGATRAGFIGLAGRPNVGKSSIVNALVGSKVAITSDRSQTTRRAIRGVATDLDAGTQLVLVDLPGVQRPRDALTERMQRRVELELASSDAVVLVLNAEQGVGPGDRFIARALLGARERPPVLCAVNKTDRVKQGPLVRALSDAAELDAVDEVFPTSATTGEGLDALTERLAELVPESPFLYPPEDASDSPQELLLAELVREQVIRRVREELPHTVEVSVQGVSERDDGIVVEAQVWCDSESQKGILIGRGGRMVRDIGTSARRELARTLGRPVHLDLSVRVRRGWRRDDGLLDRLGIE